MSRQIALKLIVGSLYSDAPRFPKSPLNRSQSHGLQLTAEQRLAGRSLCAAACGEVDGGQDLLERLENWGRTRDGAEGNPLTREVAEALRTALVDALELRREIETATAIPTERHEFMDKNTGETMVTAKASEKMIGVADVAEIFDVTVETVRRWARDRSCEVGKAAIQQTKGGVLRWRPSDIARIRGER